MIGAGAQLGVNVTVLPYVRLGEGCIVGAGSVVTRDVPAGAVVYGNPAVAHGDVARPRARSGSGSATTTAPGRSPAPRSRAGLRVHVMTGRVGWVAGRLSGSDPAHRRRRSWGAAPSGRWTSWAPRCCCWCCGRSWSLPAWRSGPRARDRCCSGRSGVGRDGRIFTMLKLRTMRTDSLRPRRTAPTSPPCSAGQAVAVDGLYKLQGDDRVTRVGRVLRRTSLDELPQLWNVLRGHMSLVGPRPSLPWEVDLFPAWARHGSRCAPGITGLWQVSGRSRLSMLDGLVLDVRYVDGTSLLFDLRHPAPDRRRRVRAGSPVSGRARSSVDGGLVDPGRRTTAGPRATRGGRRAHRRLSRVSGVVRVLVVGAVLGPTHLGDAYQVTNTLPNLIWYGFLAGSLVPALLVPVLVRQIERRRRRPGRVPSAAASSVSPRSPPR